MNDFFQFIQNGFLTHLFTWLTLLGDSYGLVIFIILSYIYEENEKNLGLVLSIAITSVGLVGLIKGLVKRPRPYENPGVTIPGSEIDFFPYGVKTTGFSFPSGHSANAAIISTHFSVGYKRKVFYIIGIVFTILIMISRMYLAQHYLTDVLTGMLIGLLITYLFLTFLHPLIKKYYRIGFLVLGCICPLLMIMKSHTITITAGLLMPLFCFQYFKGKFVSPFRCKCVFKHIFNLMLYFLPVLGLEILFNTVFITPNIVLLFLEYLVMGFWAFVIAPILSGYIFHLNNKNEKENSCVVSEEPSNS